MLFSDEIKAIMKDSKILVTGGAGFIGGNLVRQLADISPKILIVADNMMLERISGMQEGLKTLDRISNNSYELFQIDVSHYKTIKALLKKWKIDIVFNLAILPLPYSLKKPKVVFDNNVKIASVFGELLRENMYRKLIHFSSSEVYGTAKEVPMKEDHPLEPSTSYGASKAAQDLLLLSYYITYDIDIRIIRPFNNVGIGQNNFSYSAVIPRTIRRILDGKSPEIFGDGMQTRDFIWVDDTCNAAIKLACMDHLKGDVINIGSGKEMKIVDLINKICKIMDYDGEIHYRSQRPGDIRRHFADINKAKKLLGFEPIHTLDRALETIINSFNT